MLPPFLNFWLTAFVDYLEACTFVILLPVTKMHIRRKTVKATLVDYGDTISCCNRIFHLARERPDLNIEIEF